MGKKVTIKIQQVPEEQADTLSIIFHKMAFEADPINKKIMELILSHQDKPAGEIRWRIRDLIKIDRREPTIINFAKKIGIELKK